MQLSREKQRAIDVMLNGALATIGIAYPENSLLEISNKMEVKVFVKDFSFQGRIKTVKGKNVRSIVDKRTSSPRIYIDKKLSKVGKTFALAQALGCFLLHTDDFQIQEYTYGLAMTEEDHDAEYFALKLLMPEEELLIALSEGLQPSFVAAHFGVSCAILYLRYSLLEFSCQGFNC